MTFSDDLHQIAADYIELTRKKERESAAFRSGWEEIRTKVILRVFEHAVKDLSALEEDLNWSIVKSCENGSVVLKLHHPNRQNVDELRFKADFEKRLIVLTSSVDEPPGETFDLDGLQTPPVVEARVAQFVKAALKAAA